MFKSHKSSQLSQPKFRENACLQLNKISVKKNGTIYNIMAKYQIRVSDKRENYKISRKEVVKDVKRERNNLREKSQPAGS